MSTVCPPVSKNYPRYLPSKQQQTFIIPLYFRTEFAKKKKKMNQNEDPEVIDLTERQDPEVIDLVSDNNWDSDSSIKMADIPKLRFMRDNKYGKVDRQKSETDSEDEMWRDILTKQLQKDEEKKKKLAEVNRLRFTHDGVVDLYRSDSNSGDEKWRQMKRDEVEASYRPATSKRTRRPRKGRPKKYIPKDD